MKTDFPSPLFDALFPCDDGVVYRRASGWVRSGAVWLFAVGFVWVRWGGSQDVKETEARRPPKPANAVTDGKRHRRVQVRHPRVGFASDGTC